MRRLLLIIFLGFAATGFSQNTGLYGKKFCIEVNGMGTYPLFYRMVSGGQNMYKANGNSLISGKDNFDYGMRASVSYALLNNFGLGFEYGMEFTNIAAPTNITYYDPVDYNNDWSTDLKHERFRAKTMIFMPKFEFSSRNGLLPIGLNHQIGIGYTISSIQDHDYTFQLLGPSGNVPSQDEIRSKLFDYDGIRYKGMTVMYDLHVRTPISKMLMITYGIRYNLNILFRNSYTSSANNPAGYYYTGYAAGMDLRRRRMLSIINLNLGLAVAL